MGGLGAPAGAPNRQRERQRRAEGIAFLRLERVAPDLALPRVEIQWTERELARLAELVSAAEANPPTEDLIRALRD